MKTLKIIILFITLAFTFDINAQVGLKSYGQKILDNKVKPTDDKQTFQIVDSLLCKSKIDRDFYFKVFNKIQQNSDGALSEYVSTIASDYYFNHIIEFIDKTNKMSNNAIYHWLDYVAFDIYANSKNGRNDLPNIKSKINLLLSKFPEKSADKIKCKTLNDYLYKKTVELINAG